MPGQNDTGLNNLHFKKKTPVHRHRTGAFH